MRLAMLVLWIVVLSVVLLPFLRRRRVGARPPSRIASDELVKDPVCGTYIVRSRAVRRPAAEGVQFFCSAECAGRFGG